MKARKSPIPAIDAWRMVAGIARNTSRRAPAPASSRKSTPCTKIAASATCQVTPRPATTP